MQADKQTLPLPVKSVFKFMPFKRYFLNFGRKPLFQFGKNAIQRFSDVILQKSTKEGFALTVTEALWKAKPVVAGNVGGIPQQIKDGHNGYLVDPNNYRECADKVIKLLNDPKLCEDMGNKAKEYVREKFLTTRLLSDYLDLLSEVLI